MQPHLTPCAAPVARKGSTRSRTPVLWGGKETTEPRGCTQAGGNAYQTLGSRGALQPEGTVLGLIIPRAQVSQQKWRQTQAWRSSTSCFSAAWAH